MSLKSVLVLAVLAAFGSSVHASSVDTDPADWSFSNSSSPVAISSTSNGLEFSYNLVSYTVWNGAQWEVSTTPTSNGVVTFDWDNSGFYAYYNVTESLDAFAYNSDGIEQIYTLSSQSGSSVSGGFDFTGSDTISVYAGEPWGFIISGSNFDSNDTLEGDLTLSNPTPEPSSGLLFATGLLAIAAFWKFGRRGSLQS